VSVKEHLLALAAFIPKLEDKTFDAGDWGGGGTNDGVMTMPFFMHGDDMGAFLDAARPLMMPNFDWGKWAEASHVQANIETASLDDLRRLIHRLIRQERFVEGLLARAYTDGDFLRIARRAGQLAHES
jgi:hypothetical protein